MSLNDALRAKALVVAFLSIAVLVACLAVPEMTSSCIDSGCGVHGKCAIEVDPPACVCEPGYTGPACAECAAGFQDANGNGYCSPSCGSKVCGLHKQCSTASGRAVCECVAGYSLTDGGGCRFMGGPVDPSFDDPRPDGWETSGAVTIETGEIPGVRGGTGWARFSGTGEVFQSFGMPVYADAEPLALEVDFWCAASGCSNVQGALLVRLNDRVSEQSVGWPARLHMCLGEAAFGRMLTLGIGVLGVDRPTPPHPEGDLLVGSAAFVPDPSCPAPGTVQNGDFKTGDWEITSRFGTVGYVEEQTTRRARLRSACAGAAEMTTRISIPEAPTSALAFSIEGTPEGETLVAFDNGVALAPIPGTGKKERIVKCIPPRMRGFAYELRVAVPPPRRAACDHSKQNIVYVDEVAFVAEPTCADLPAGP